MAKQNNPTPLKPEANPAGMTLLRTLRGHSDTIFGIAFSPDGKKIASGSGNNTIKIWDAGSGENTATLEGHTSAVYSVSFSPDGKKIASGSNDKTIKIWDADSGKNMATLLGHTHEVWCVSFSRDGKKVASGSYDKTIKIWDAGSGKNITTLLGHTGEILSVAFSADGKKVASSASDSTIKIWDIDSGNNITTLLGHRNIVLSVFFNLDGKKIISGSWDETIRIWDVQSGKSLHILEGHTKPIRSCLFIANDQLLASQSEDGTVRIWRTDSWQTVTILAEPSSMSFLPKMAVHPTKPILAIPSEEDTVIKLWELDYSVLLGKDVITDSVPYTTAKIALVGDSGVGKTGLGWRLAHGKFKEHSSTHGQQFWVIDELGKKRADGTECEAVLWDLAGQQDYRLVHALFLKDVDVALLLFDPGNREKQLSGVEYWIKQLCVDQKSNLQKVLIGARTDRGKPTMTSEELQEFCDFHQIKGGYLATSAKAGLGVGDLMEQLKAMIPWEDMPATITTHTFKRVKEFVLKLKEQSSRRSVLVSPAELRRQLEATDKEWEFTDPEMMTAVGHLENHGYVRICAGSDGKQAILLFPDILVNLASSFVLEARGNPQGLGVLEEKKLLAGDYDFQDLKTVESDAEREVLLDTATTLFLKRNICFRETLEGAQKHTLLVFPSLINEKRPKTTDIETEDDVSYLVRGAVENVYASMVVLLGYTEQFTRKHQWQNQAQYELKENQVCGFRQSSEHEGEIELTLYYNKTIPAHGRLLFQGLFETFLLHRELQITRFEVVQCPKCKERQERAAVMKRIENKHKNIFCSNCGHQIQIPETTALTPLAGVDRDTIAQEEARVSQRTKYEAALVRIKAILRERGEKADSPSCFISYAWGVEAHEKWVLQLAKDLRNAEIDVLLDRWHNPPSSSITKFISKIGAVDFALAVGTKKYLEKYETEDTDPVVDMEIRMIETRLRKRTAIRETVIPLLLEDSPKASFPLLFEDSVYIDFTDEKRYFVQLFRLILRLYDIPFDHPGLDELIDSLKPGRDVLG
ncbi:MAG: TIR domain-containing protein [Phycisphaerae bacterium]|nr:TIR domain-containing protein [Saprospiraceae bacterium]